MYSFGYILTRFNPLWPDPTDYYRHGWNRNPSAWCMQYRLEPVVFHIDGFN